MKEVTKPYVRGGGTRQRPYFVTDCSTVDESAFTAKLVNRRGIVCNEPRRVPWESKTLSYMEGAPA